MSIIKRINIVPDRTLYNKLGQSGYSFSEAIAELIDNAIDARIDDKIVEINVIINNEKVIIKDNAKGMGEKEAQESIRLGSSSKKGAFLGQFGLGLKSACNSIGDKFTLLTSPINSNYGYRLEFDNDLFQDSGSWESFPMEILDRTPPGGVLWGKTLVFIGIFRPIGRPLGASYWNIKRPCLFS